MPVLTAILSAAVIAQASASPAPRAEPAPAPAQSEPLTLTMRFAGREGERPVPFEVAKGIVVFTVKIAGRDALAVLDNGAQGSLIDQSFAKEAGFQIGPSEGVIVTVAGSVPKRRVSNVPLSIPGAFETDIPALAAMDLSAVSRIVGKKINFVFGADFFNITTVMVDASRGMMRIGPRGAARLPPTIPVFAVAGERPHIQAAINGKPVSLMVDLGANNMLVLTPEAWARIGGSADSGRSHTNYSIIDGAKSQVQTELLPSVTLGPIHADNVTASIQPWPISQGDGAIGFGLLRRFVVIADLGEKRLWLARPAAAPPTP